MINGLINRIVTTCRRPLLIAGVGLVFALGMSSCFKEKPIKQPYINNSGDIHIADMGENYTRQLYFNLQTQVFVDSNSKYDYDMAFDCDPASYNVWLNGANLMEVWHTGKYNFADVSFADTATNPLHEELGSGIPAQNAIGVWGNYPNSNKEVYILSLGEDSNGVNLGFRKMQMGDCIGDSYIVSYCNMDGSNLQTVSVPRKANRNKVYLSFNNKQIHDFEPDQNNWDLIFTQYSVYFPSPYNLPYKVTGVLTNPFKTQAYFKDSTSDYSKITLDSVQTGRFTSALDNIGYAWKVYEGFLQYYVDGRHIYIIKSGNHYYKLRFINFSNSSNQKGYPEFQYDELQ